MEKREFRMLLKHYLISYKSLLKLKMSSIKIMATLHNLKNPFHLKIKKLVGATSYAPISFDCPS